MHHSFTSRHIGPSDDQRDKMLRAIGCETLDQLIDETVPSKIRLKQPLSIAPALSEAEFLADFKALMDQNIVARSYIGMGYSGCRLPGVIQRNIFENPGWYTQYTPYQSEISQGRLEALANFQAMIMDLTGMDLANASLLDEGTAAAEAMTLLYRARPRHVANASRNVFFASECCFPQTLEILKTRAKYLDIELVIGAISDAPPEAYGVLVQYPDDLGNIDELSSVFSQFKSNDIGIACAADLLALTLIESPGKMGADVVIGSSQRFGVPLGFGGPSAAYIGCKDAYRRQVPGRIIGQSKDSNGKNAYRMALQTREQHIRREKATSNICTAQVLLAIMAGMYAVYHGPDGLRAIARRVHHSAQRLAVSLQRVGCKLASDTFFDTVVISDGVDCGKLKTEALKQGVNFRYYDNGSVGISLDETVTDADLSVIVAIVCEANGKSGEVSGHEYIPYRDSVARTTQFLQQPVFNTYHSETNMLRYIRSLEAKDLSLGFSMIPLGSCTMKLNATTEMIPLSWASVGDIHPYAPEDQTKGYLAMVAGLKADLAHITGLPGVSLQPNSGAQGEYAGLLAIRNYFEKNGQSHRDTVLIPASSHGTNFASASMLGMEIKVIRCLDNGNVDTDHLAQLAESNKDRLCALLITYPSTCGIFEEGIRVICDSIHDFGGLVYMDGANMNAQVGFTSPGQIGADVCHLNLHKTFAIPHGGGGPGMGPICVTEDLIPFLPGNPVSPAQSQGPVSAAPYGSASVLAISYAYIKLLGSDGLVSATSHAILNANYLKARLFGHYKILYEGTFGRVAHELVVDVREFKKSAGVEVEDIAKRLIDYGFHAPTMSWPTPGTLMIEPTESEDMLELDRFADALISIREEIQEIMDGDSSQTDNVLKNAPHSPEMVMSDTWGHSYTRETAAYPLPFVRDRKFWPSVGRVDNAYGDRNFVCSCFADESGSNDDIAFDGSATAGDAVFQLVG